MVETPNKVVATFLTPANLPPTTPAPVDATFLMPLKPLMAPRLMSFRTKFETSPFPLIP